jgi:hypothetical protein
MEHAMTGCAGQGGKARDARAVDGAGQHRLPTHAVLNISIPNNVMSQRYRTYYVYQVGTGTVQCTYSYECIL